MTGIRSLGRRADVVIDDAQADVVVADRHRDVHAAGVAVTGCVAQRLAERREQFGAHGGAHRESRPFEHHPWREAEGVTRFMGELQDLVTQPGAAAAECSRARTDVRISLIVVSRSSTAWPIREVAVGGSAPTSGSVLCNSIPVAKSRWIYGVM